MAYVSIQMWISPFPAPPHVNLTFIATGPQQWNLNYNQILDDGGVFTFTIGQDTGPSDYRMRADVLGPGPLVASLQIAGQRPFGLPYYRNLIGAGEVGPFLQPGWFSITN